MTANDRHFRSDLSRPSPAHSQNHRPPAQERLREHSLLHVDLGRCAPERRSSLLQQVDAAEFVLVIGNDLRIVPLLVDWIAQRFVDAEICDRRMAGRLGVALGEAVVNAIVHGNLEVGSDIRDDPGNLYDKTIEARRLDPRFRRRRVKLLCDFNGDAGRITVRDEGRGFNVADVPDPTDKENLARPYGRGILLIRAFFDEVHYSPQGNSVTMLKRRTTPAATFETPSSSVAVP